MSGNKDFKILIMDLPDTDLKQIYQTVRKRLKDEKDSGKDTSGTEHILTIISAEMIRRRKKEIKGSNKDPNLKIAEKNYINDKNILTIKKPDDYGRAHSSSGDKER